MLPLSGLYPPNETPVMEVKEIQQAFNVKIKSALDTQEGGDHYKRLKIQPVEFIEMNRLSFLEGCIVKRICRYRSKDGGKDALKDLNKIKHEVDLLIDIHLRDRA